MKKIYRWMPGLSQLVNYRKEWIGKDIIAGLSLAVIALPISLALSGLLGLDPQVGLYATILPMTVFALFSSANQLIIGPDAPTCMMMAAVLLPFATESKESYYEISIILTILVGILSVIAGLLRLGFISDFLSKPILAGYMNGLTFTIIISQVDKIFGFTIFSGDFFSMGVYFFSHLNDTREFNMILGLSAIIFLLIINKFLPKIPSSLLAIILGSLAVILFELNTRGVATVGFFPSGLPSFGIPEFNAAIIRELIPGAISIVLISYCSQMLTTKSFAIKQKKDVDPNQEFIALGAASLSSGLSGGFAVSGADSLTAVAHSSGGKTPLTSIIASAALVLVLYFLTGLLAYVPYAVLGAIVIVSVLGLLDLPYLKKLYRMRKQEFFISIITTLCVLTIGVMYGVVFGIAIALINLIRRASKPEEEILGRVGETNVFGNIKVYRNAAPVDGIVIYKFNAALVFFNSGHFRNEIRKFLTVKNKPDWILIDAAAINYIDATANDVLETLADEMKNAGITLAFASVQKGVTGFMERSGLKKKIGDELFFITVGSAVEAFLTSKKKSVS